MPEDIFLHLGQRIKEAREKCGLTQQELADQTGRGLRYLQDIEKGRKNPSFDVLASFIRRLGIFADELFYPGASEQEKQVQYFMGKFLACTEEKRQIILKTLDCMAEQFISRHYKASDPQDYE
ncbi:helix-turn-helix domain-containing protein [Faecalibacterium prausnitzii]|jgi:transcriptional regulator with XRE-family HTH domain|uniref:helix-turn-helix domain-containing protein n=1 Tax=Faecalibacterium prausnitzii TaxID=853 RepID=UPI0022E79B5B|nr:helix-turn-helix transcriptional regulator [Faecalibacterium prausnitzii]